MLGNGASALGTLRAKLSLPLEPGFPGNKELPLADMEPGGIFLPSPSASFCHRAESNPRSSPPELLFHHRAPKSAPSRPGTALQLRLRHH